MSLHNFARACRARAILNPPRRTELRHNFAENLSPLVHFDKVWTVGKLLRPFRGDQAAVNRLASRLGAAKSRNLGDEVRARPAERLRREAQETNLGVQGRRTQADGELEGDLGGGEQAVGSKSEFEPSDPGARQSKHVHSQSFGRNALPAIDRTALFSFASRMSR